MYVDEILIRASTRAEHDERLKAVLRAASNAGIMLNTAKCKIGVTEIAFLDTVISDKGIQQNLDDTILVDTNFGMI